MNKQNIINNAYNTYPPRYGAYGRDLNKPKREGYIKAHLDMSKIWHDITEKFDRSRFIVFTDGTRITNGKRFLINVEDMWLRDQKEKEGIEYNKWAYEDEIISL